MTTEHDDDRPSRDSDHPVDQTALLYDLVRSLYRDKHAQDILESFDAALIALPDPQSRAELVAYWLDFYRLQRYKLSRRRRRPKLTERLTACSACGYPTSHRHHLWDVATHGENKVTIQLCANCHELHHLMYNTLVKRSEYSRRLVLHTLRSGRLARERGERILGWCLATIEYETRNGWLMPGMNQPEWVETQLEWSSFLRQSETVTD